MSDPTIDDLKAIQAALGLRDSHVCWIGPSGFVIAHTDEERATIDLEDCALHQWLFNLAGPPAATGYYRAFEHVADPDSEPYGSDAWDLAQLDTVAVRPAEADRTEGGETR